mgnify:CR=1 FL=1
MVRLPTKAQRLAMALSLLPMLLPTMAAALEYRSVNVAKATLYDAPSAQGKKTLLLGQGYPVEIIVNLGDWLKVRDAQGTLSWVESKSLGNKRTVLIRSAADLRQSADAAANLLGRLDKDVVLDVLESPANGWVKVKHRDGLTGYVQSTAVWGL